MESTDDENNDDQEGILPPLAVGDDLRLIEASATQ